MKVNYVLSTNTQLFQSTLFKPVWNIHYCIRIQTVYKRIIKFRFLHHKSVWFVSQCIVTKANQPAITFKIKSP